MAWLRPKAMRRRQAPWGRSQGLARGIGSPSREPACLPACAGWWRGTWARLTTGPADNPQRGCPVNLECRPAPGQLVCIKRPDGVNWMPRKARHPTNTLTLTLLKTSGRSSLPPTHAASDLPREMQEKNSRNPHKTATCIILTIPQNSQRFVPQIWEFCLKTPNFHHLSFFQKKITGTLHSDVPGSTHPDPFDFARNLPPGFPEGSRGQYRSPQGVFRTKKKPEPPNRPGNGQRPPGLHGKPSWT